MRRGSRIAAIGVVLLLAGSALAEGAQGATKSPHGKLDLDCAECHTATAWRPLRKDLRFDHGTTGFPLVGLHKRQACAACHKSPIFSHVPTLCVDCHRDAHRGELGLSCESCHTSFGWDNRDAQRRSHSTHLFPLTGVHASLDCAACHRGQAPFEYVETPIDCYSCHRSDFQNTTQPNHVTAHFPTDCIECHTTQGWQTTTIGAGFQHDLIFPLTGAHRTLDCAQCHHNGFTGAPTACVGCHRADYDKTTDPNHAQAGFPTTCATCHNTTSWSGASFNHDSVYPLTGAHKTLECAQCHASGYAGTPTACVGCHKSDYDKTTNPNHAQAGFPTTCETCHNTTSWTSGGFDHNSVYPLTGAHKTLDCAQCHANGYAGAPTTCVGCHRSDYDKTTNPNHAQAGFSTSCQACHNTSTWAEAKFNHDSVYPLTGAHKTLDCAQCHANGYAGTPTSCVGCHRSDYDKTTNPNHAQAGFPTTCDTCHTTSSWAGATFDHDKFYPLTGAHKTLDCAQCHANGYAGTPASCVGCHRSDYDKTTNPNHAQAGFPTTCDTCHTTSSWAGATFDHDKFYPLTGAHKTLDCAQCHRNGYSGTPTSCVGCHRSDYDKTNNPNHAAAGFPTTCQTCHTTSSWAGATFNHDGLYFPIYSGAHQGAWTKCSDCHVNSSNYTVFECINCHAHDRSRMDQAHSDVRNYQYVSSACYSCHPRGRADD